MKEITGVLSSESFRLLIIYVIPGGMVVYPAYKLAISRLSEIAILIPSGELGRFTILVAVSIVVGLVLENLGGRIEKRFDKCATSVPKPIEQLDVCNRYWILYLLKKWDKEPIAQSYIRSILMRMKFELSGGLASIILAVELAIFSWPPCPAPGIFIIAIISAASGGYLIWEAKTSHALLHDLRCWICEEK